MRVFLLFLGGGGSWMLGEGGDWISGGLEGIEWCLDFLRLFDLCLACEGFLVRYH